jgi:hypothetical protein
MPLPLDLGLVVATVSVLENTATSYRLRFQTRTGAIDTPNLRGASEADTVKLLAFYMWQADYTYTANNPVFFNGKLYFANPASVPAPGQSPATHPAKWIPVPVITTSLSAASTDAEVPSAKTVYTVIGNIGAVLDTIQGEAI